MVCVSWNQLSLEPILVLTHDCLGHFFPAINQIHRLLAYPTLDSFSKIREAALMSQWIYHSASKLRDLACINWIRYSHSKDFSFSTETC